MDTIFDPRLRDRAIETTCSNLIMAGQLEPTKVLRYMSALILKTDGVLAETLCASRLLYDRYLENRWNGGSNGIY